MVWHHSSVCRCGIADFIVFNIPFMGGGVLSLVVLSVPDKGGVSGKRLTKLAS